MVFFINSTSVFFSSWCTHNRNCAAAKTDFELQLLILLGYQQKSMRRVYYRDKLYCFITCIFAHLLFSTSTLFCREHHFCYNFIVSKREVSLSFTVNDDFTFCRFDFPRNEKCYENGIFIRMYKLFSYPFYNVKLIIVLRTTYSTQSRICQKIKTWFVAHV